MKSLLATLALTLLAATASAAPAVSKAEAEKFFAQYQALANNFDTAVTDLYAPTAKLVGTSHPDASGDKDTGRQEVTGAQWKQLITFNMAKAKKRNDKFTFDKVRYEPQGDKMRIRAERYSVIKCTADKTYTMLIGRQADGKLLIEEEAFQTHLPGNCK